jgi:hypothetical protein
MSTGAVPVNGSTVVTLPGMDVTLDNDLLSAYLNTFYGYGNYAGTGG